MQTLANVSLAPWQAVFLLLLSFGSLVIALYCLFFMVPLKKFVRRIESLGGGMEGLRKHLNGMEKHLEEELERIETAQADRVDHVKTETTTRLEYALESVEKFQESLNHMKKNCESLQNSVEGLQRTAERNAAGGQQLEARLQELQRDMSILADETEGKLHKRVREAFYELEATILSTLEVLRDELIRPNAKGSSTTEPSMQQFSHRERDKKRSDKGHDPEESKIISAGPLFSRTDKPESEKENGESDDEEGGDNGKE